MAFKATSRPEPPGRSRGVEAVGGDLNDATSVESTAYYARVIRAECRSRSTFLSRHLSDPAFDPEERSESR